MEYNQACEVLEKYGQQQVLRFYDELTKGQKKELLDQIEETDFSIIDEGGTSLEESKGKITPIEAMQLDEIEKRKEEFYNIGIDSIKKGKVGAVLLAGGMGTRLGSDDPKGMYNIGETKDVYIFQRLIENLMDIVKQSGTWIHLFIMTSEKNNDATIKFFTEHDYFGYKKEYIAFFKQEMAPAVDYNRKIYMESKFRMSTSPNGNGGWFSSMIAGGITDIIKAARIEWINVFSVDNVLQKIADPYFIGATIAGGYSSGSKVVRKAAPDEKVGVMCLEDGRPSIVEYYELTDELMSAKDSKGGPAYNFGVILNYLFRVKDLFEVVKENMPLHIVEKKIQYIDEKGQNVNPQVPNGYKYETLILDMIHLLPDCLPYEVIRNKEFAPIKNKTGVDSVESAKKLCKENGIEL